MPGHLLGMKASPSLPALTITKTNASKRNLSHTRLPSRSPIPLPFLPPRGPVPSTPSVASQESASSAALATFLDAKRGQQLTVEDFRVIDTLTANVKSESVAGSPQRSTFKTDGWSAGTFSATPRAIRPLRKTNGLENVESTPVRPESPFGSPGPAFSIGIDTPLASTTTPTQRRVTYLGPGMSPRRMFPKPASGLKPLFNLDLSPEGESAYKKRRTEDGEDLHGVSNQSVLSRSNGFSNSVSMPSLAFPNGTGANLDKSQAHIPERPSFGDQNPVVPRQDAVTVGKKRAADIMKELIDEEIGPNNGASQPDYMVINPYDTESSASPSTPTPSTPRSPMRSATQRRSVLRSSLRGNETSKRGAAAKLEAHRSGRKLTTLEILQGRRPVSHMQLSTKRHTYLPSGRSLRNLIKATMQVLLNRFRSRRQQRRMTRWRLMRTLTGQLLALPVLPHVQRIDRRRSHLLLLHGKLYRARYLHPNRLHRSTSRR